jgi:hypothetical protein
VNPKPEGAAILILNEGLPLRGIRWSG